MERLTREETIMVGGREKAACNHENDDCNDSCMYGRCRWQEKANMLLKEYEDTGLTPQEIMELNESVQRLDKIFGDEITVDQVIDFFVDFYIAQCDDERVEAAELLTNEEVERYKQLKERDTAKAPVDIDEEFDMYVCPSCNMAIGAMGDREEHKFCLNCGQRLKWRE